MVRIHSTAYLFPQKTKEVGISLSFSEMPTSILHLGTPESRRKPYWLDLMYTALRSTKNSSPV